MPSASTATWWTSAPAAANTGTAPGIGRPLGEHRVAGIDQHAADQVERLLPAGGHDQLAGADQRAVLGHQVGDRVAQLVETLGGAVLEGARAVVGGHVVDQLRSRSGGKAFVSGRPPASEITSGRDVIAIRSRMADDRNEPVRCAYSRW